MQERLTTMRQSYRTRYSATRDACDYNTAHSTIFVCDVLHGDRVRRMISSGVRKKLRRQHDSRIAHLFANCRIIGPSDYRTVGLTDRRIYDV